jgi:hypothetical protein
LVGEVGRDRAEEVAPCQGGCSGITMTKQR